MYCNTLIEKVNALQLCIILRVNGMFWQQSWENIDNDVWNLEHNAEKLQEILNRIKIQGIMSIITSTLGDCTSGQ